MDLGPWFENQLRASGEGFVWGLLQVPAERRTLAPPPPLGEWSAARHAFHMVYYEREFALPNMRRWLGEAPAPHGPAEDDAWAAGHLLEDLLEQFRAVRAAQVRLAVEIAPAAWETPLDTVWGAVPLRWVVTKTYQHTAEHTHDVLSMALFWDLVEAALQGRA